ncbi:MAG TPA: lipase secretion chaperone [Kofleriaceae bacterium]|nr:lipase secretion chaperone [Kofleriaceae bacterium]
MALVVAGVIAWRAHTPALPRAEHPDERTQARRSSMQTAAAAPALSAPRYPDVPVPATLPASLEGTEPDGAVEADAAGHLIVTLELRRLFDHFLAASGEEPIATMRARIIAVLRQRLPATAAGEAIEILDRYLAYRDAARTLAPPPSSDRISALDQVHDLRARMFSPEVARAFFADEEAAIRAALARRDILADSSLSAAERERRLAELDARAPAAVREARAQATAPIDELARETAMRAAGASDAEINATRTAALGADAAARLAELDRQHAAWNARLAQYRAARAAILADSRLGDAERQRQIDELLARSFTAQERIRVETLDHMAAGSAAR